ncbi:hypothetical protein FO519_005794 [Halicephalobus sp. NKZ332]|nr:hypothetical protein FO519_005794 [Halicephalobus sp. NKZ332]
MALISVQRSPSPVLSDLDESFTDAGSSKSQTRGRNSEPTIPVRSLSEFYFTVKGAAVILTHQDESNFYPRSCSEDKDLELHLQCMLRLIRQQNIMSRVVRLQSIFENVIRYLAVVETSDSSNQDAALFGFDLDTTNASIGLIVPITSTTKVKLDGDGGISVETFSDIYFFKPVSIQAMWSVFQYLNKEVSTLIGKRRNQESWNAQYNGLMTKEDSVRGLWHTSLVHDSMVGDLKAQARNEDPEAASDEEVQIKKGLRQIMQSVDLDEVTSKDIREKLEEHVGRSLVEQKTLIDKEMLVIMGQLDKPSKIFEYLYLGTEWNASNWEELKSNKVGYILNVTKEVDNFYPNQFVYKKIWVSDEATTELLMHWQNTYDFIKKAKSTNSVVLVHCKKGISRSSSTVIAYIMKEYGWSLDVALNYVKEKRNCITPNSGFMEQLETFDGMLQASSNRHSYIFNTSPSTESSGTSETIPRLAKSTEMVKERIGRIRIESSVNQQSKKSTNAGKKLRSLSFLNPFSSKFAQEKNDIAYRISKSCTGKVRQHRDKFEKASSRNTFPPANSHSNKQKDSNSDGDDEVRSVKSLVDVFEKCSSVRPDFEIQSPTDSSLITSMT